MCKAFFSIQLPAALCLAVPLLDGVLSLCSYTATSATHDRKRTSLFFLYRESRGDKETVGKKERADREKEGELDGGRRECVLCHSSSPLFSAGLPPSPVNPWMYYKK